MDPIKAKGEDEEIIKKKEDEDSNLDAEFIKVEKESVCSGKSSPSRELIEAHKKVEELEHELVSATSVLKNSESEITRLNDEVSYIKAKLVESERNNDELEIYNKKLEKQISEGQETKQKEMNDVQEAYDDLQVELESSKKAMLEVKQELKFSEDETLKFMELHRQSGVNAELEMKKALEFERLLEMAKVSAVEVESQMTTLQEELLGLYEKIAENEKVEEAYKFAAEKNLQLELQLKSAAEKEEVLIERLNMTMEEKINLADALNNTTEKLVEAENSLHLTQNELNLAHQKLESAENDLEAAGLRETEVLEKLKLAEEQLEKHRDLELKLQEVIANFNSKDFEVQALEEQVMIYKEQTMEAADRSATLKEEYDQIALKLAKSESVNEELKKRVSHAEDQATQSFSEIDMLVETNTQLKSKINELQESLDAEYAEKKETTQKLSSNMSAIMELNDQHSKASERADSHKIELEQALTKLKDLECVVIELQNRSNHFEKECEGLAGVNFNLTQELSDHEFKLNDIQTKLSATLSDKEEATEQLHASQNTVEDLKLQLSSDNQRLQSQISSLMEENNLLTETHQKAKDELQTAVIQLERQIKQHKSNEHALTTQIDEKSALSDRLKELEEQLIVAEAQLKEEKEVKTRQEMETDAKKKAFFLLENQVKELEQKLQHNEAKNIEKDLGAKTSEKFSSQSTSYLEIQTKTTEVSSSINFRFILIIALVSVIVGAILGKRY